MFPPPRAARSLPRRWPNTYLAALVCLLAGCATPPDQIPTDPDWPRHAAQLTVLEHWRASGKISLRNAHQSESASIAWAQRDERTELVLSGPLGMGATTITSDGEFLELTQGGISRRYDISSPEAIIQEAGWGLPLNALRYWLKGLPAPQLEVQEMQLEQGRLARLAQSGWTISYQSYGHFGSYLLPVKLQIEANDTRIRLIIRDWHTGAV